MTLDLTSTFSRRLLQRQLPDGGFAEHPDGEFRPDATAWCILALKAVAAGGTTIGPGRRRLSNEQRHDGRVSISREVEEAAWPTSLAVLAWNAAPEFRESQDRAVRFLLDSSGLHWPRQTDSPIAHDTSIRGWPWVAGTHSWIEPTALAVLALRASGQADHPRTREALKMILDRQLDGGGWNYGNTRVYGQTLLPMPDATGLALRALAGNADQAAVESSLDYLETIVEGLRTPFSLAWALLGLGAWGRRPAKTRSLVSSALESESRLGAYATSHLSLLLLALADYGGVSGIPPHGKGGDRG